MRQQVNAHSNDKVTTSIVSLTELHYEVENSAEQDREHNSQKLEEFISVVEYLDFSETAARHFGQQKVRLRKLGQPIADIDLLIASIALAEDAVLVTDNLKHFARISGLRLENWK